ncbi:MAG: outer membrane protein assembly factor BamD [Longimicrobiales bacterium]
MTKRHATLRMLLAVVIALSACAGGSTVKKVEPNALWQQAMDGLAAGKWTEATRLFERFTLEFPTDSRYQEARYHLSEARFGAKEYITAATEFARLSSDFPAGPFADDAQFKVCESYQRLSPDIELDQEYTQGAVDHCQVLLSYFPASEFVPRATAILAEMTDKLAHKLYWTGDYYFRRKAYDPAIMYYELVAKTYPISAYAPRALNRMVDAYKILGYDTEEAATRARLLKDYPESVTPKPKPDSVGRR